MIKLPLDQMTREEKLMALEALWQDLAREEDRLESPAWHQEELAKTEARMKSGEEEVLNWDAAKKELRERFE